MKLLAGLYKSRVVRVPRNPLQDPILGSSFYRALCLHLQLASHGSSKYKKAASCRKTIATVA